MTNKEFIQEEIYWLEDLFEQAKRDNRNAVIIELEEEIKQYNQVLKDLEVLEILKKEPYLSLNDYYKGNNNDYNFYLKNIIEPKITREEYYKVKEWLDDKQRKND